MHEATAELLAVTGQFIVAASSLATRRGRIVDWLAGMVIIAGVPAVPGVPSEEELLVLPASALAAQLPEAYRLIAELTARTERLSARVDELERQARSEGRPPRRPPAVPQNAGTGPVREV